MKKMKEIIIKNKIMLFITVISLVTAVFSLVAFADGTPGSSGDPLVSKSYVDGKVAEIMALLSGSGTSSGITAGDISESRIVEKVLDQMEYLTGSGGGSKYTPVSAEKGQSIIGGEGTEIILRSGSATAYVQVSDGIVNATTGQELFQGAAIPANNIIIVPREDGRGVTAASESWFIIKGSYTIIN